MGKHQHRDHQYPRVSTREQAQSVLLDGHEAVNDNMRATIDKLNDTIETMAFTIHMHEKSLDEYAATVRTRDGRIAELTQDNARLEALAEQRRVDLDVERKRLRRVAMRGQG